MDLYDTVSYEAARNLTLRYSTSFGSATKLYPKELRGHIYAIYGWVRIGDEIVDTYRGADAAQRLDAFEAETMLAIKSGFSTNPIIHAFAHTAKKYHIDAVLIRPFLNSMRMDLSPPNRSLTRAEYKTYINGSAEVVGLMCLKVFVQGDEKTYMRLRPGAKSLGSAFQKVNFLRDFAQDVSELGRSYFPNVAGSELTEKQKAAIIIDIRHDFTHALPAVFELPKSAAPAVRVAAAYYTELLKRLEAVPAHTLSKERIRVPDWRKAQILATVTAKESIRMRRNAAS